jgi:hypothetical protein
LIVRFLVGIALVLAFASVSAQTARELEFQRGADELRAKWAAQFAALDERFKANEVSDALAPNKLVSADAIRRSREKVRVRLLLIEERAGVLKRYLDEAEVYFQTANIDTAVGQAAMQNAAATRPKTMKLHRELAAAEVSTLGMVDEILDFAEARLGRIVFQNGGLVFTSPEEFKRYNELVDRLREAVIREQKAFEAYIAFQQESRQHVEELKQRLP